MNPLVNPGAIATVGNVKGSSPDEVWDKILRSTPTSPAASSRSNQPVYKSESDTNQRNRAISSLMSRLRAVPDGSGRRGRPLHPAMLDQRHRHMTSRVMAATLAIRRHESRHRQAGHRCQPRAGPPRDHGDRRHVRRQRQMAVPHRPADQERRRRRPDRRFARASSASARSLRRSTPPATACAASARSRTSCASSAPTLTRNSADRSRCGGLRTSLRSALCVLVSPSGSLGAARGESYLFDDAHFHLTNYVQKGLTAREYVKMMGIDRQAVDPFGIPLQQTWSYVNSGNFAPTYYLQTDAPLYYYSFTDAMIAHGVSVAAAERSRAARSDDHRLQPDRHVRRRSYPPRA